MHPNRSYLPSHYKTGEVVSADTHKGEVDERHLTARFYRAHLQQALAQHVDPARIHLSKAFHSLTIDDDDTTQKQTITITFTDGTTAPADIVLGADGIHSSVRGHLAPTSGPPSPTGWVALRSVFPTSRLSHIPPGDIPSEAEHIWGPDRTLFVSRLGRDLFTVVGSYQYDPAAVPSGPDRPYHDAHWDSPGDTAALRSLYRDWHPRYRAIVDATPQARVYPNSAARALDTWVLGGGGGRVTLAGDAAHAHGGAFAAGGSLALDDAWAFGAAVSHVFPAAGGGPLPGPAGGWDALARALRLYERTRKGHADRVMAVVRGMNARKVERLGEVLTDEELRACMRERYDTTWIHEHDVEGAFAEALESMS